MSTTDPALARRLREQARVGRPGALVWLLVSELLLIVGAALLVRGMFGFAEIPADGTDDPPLGVFGIAAGLPVVLLSTFMHVGALRRYTGKLLGRSPFLGITPLMFVGFAAGAWWGWATTRDAWLWIPLAITAAAAVLVVLAVSARVGRRRQDGILDEVAATGRIVPGVVTEIAEIDPSSGGLIGPITVKFADASGTDRWVTKLGQWRRADLPKKGDPASVLFDPSAPGDTRRIWVGPAGARGAQDFRA
ncbi:hypothetical protein KNO15_18900 [Leifsonia shinshuensis]|uniref:hypothetical protein n=1 Tax=Leifsonia shinshuensis TaxID=150026 RepID=UPI001F50CBDE|nr:hypothetical protein [Leifsonia shinshuensis]MCI0158773.1 hypothetical protein [Leifsonia shinshuensis]